ncbi:MAG: peptidase prolyl oligopeptidase active site domain protein [Pseudonocardiales bacterium]|nr:peptidase prolyl oligopeptidase active site domain protein [Pseudonocardiales bacterium]
MSPDGRQVAYVSDRNGVPQLWVQDVGDVGEAIPVGKQLELSADPVVSVHWSADGHWLAAVLATDGGVRTQVWVVRPDGGDARCVAGSREQHATLGPWTRNGHRLVVAMPPGGPLEESVCDLVDPVTGRHQLLAHGVLVDVLDLSPDERFALLRDGTRGAQFVRTLDRVRDKDFDLLPYPGAGSTESGFLRVPPPGIIARAEGLARTDFVAYLITDAGVSRYELLAVPIGPDGRRGSGGAIMARHDADVEFADADDNGRLMVVAWNVDGRSELELLDLVTNERIPVDGLPGEVVTHCVMSRRGDRVLVCVEGADQPRRLWLLDTRSLYRRSREDRRAIWRPVTESSLVTDHELAAPTLLRFEAHDGMPLSGWLYRPFDAVGPGPVMISLHGGPESQERPTFSAQHQAMVASGITVFAPNVRGSSGFGRAFMHSDDRYGRHDAIDDVASCVEALVTAGIAEPGRVAVTGRSYGGYLTLAALAWHPNLFAAGVDVCGMSDLQTFYRDTESWIAWRSVTKYGDPVRDAELLRLISPLRRVRRIKAPLLVVHGELDTNVPIGEAHQIVAALRALDRPVEYLELMGEGHEYRRLESRLLLIDGMVGFLIRTLRVGVDPSAN